MKTKKRLNLILLTALVFMCCLFVAFGFTFKDSKTASAATTPKYTVHFSYRAWYKSNTSEATVGSSNDTTSCSAQIGQYTTSTYSVNLYGSAYSGTAELSNGGYINSNTVTIVVNSSSGNPTVTVTNSSGTTIGSGSGNVTLSALSDGMYTVKFAASGGWLVNNRQYDQAGIEATFSFKVDTVAPALNGTTSSTTGKYTNVAFTVSATDSNSGVKALYMKAPGASSYTNVGMSKTVSAGSTNGLYAFFAVDFSGNSSAVGYFE